MANYADRRVWAMTAAESKLSELRKQEATVERTTAIYRDANKQIQDRVRALYDELATEDEQNAWRFEGLNTPATISSASELRKKIEAAGLTEYVPERLQRRLSVYEVLELDNWYTLTKAGQDAHSVLKTALAEKVQDQGEIWQRALNAGAESFIGFDRNQVGYMLGENWYGGNFSSRLWNENQASWEKVQEEIAKAIASGQDPQVTRRKLAGILGNAYLGPDTQKGLTYAVERIVRTEMARAATNADIIKWQNEGINEVQWNARLEANTCEHCEERDGRVYKLNQAHDLVPLHPNCRCFLTPYDRVAEAARGEQKRQRQYKDEDGEYELIDWAPIKAIQRTDKGWKYLPVSDYFFTASPWLQYKPTKTSVKFVGEINDGYTELAATAIQDVINQYPEIGYELKNSYANTIYEHRGMSATVGGGVDRIGGVVWPTAKTDQVGVALAYPSTLSGTPAAIRKAMADLAKSQHAQGFWSTDKVQHTIVHEMGHVLEQYIRKRATPNPGETMQQAGDRAILEILETATGTKGKKNTLTELKASISRYSGKNISEGFAELFARSVAQDVQYNDRTTALFVTELNSRIKELPQQAKTTKVKLSTEGQTIKAPAETGAITEQSWIKSLTAQEKQAIRAYTGYGEYVSYTDVNDALRAGLLGKETKALNTNDWTRNKMAETIDGLDSAISKFTLTKEKTVWRGLREDLMGNSYRQMLEGLKPGSVFEEKAYTSTATTQSGTSEFKGGWLMKIKVPAGNGRGIYTRNLSEYTEENEFLIKRGAKYKVTKVTTKKNSWGGTDHFLEVEMLDDTAPQKITTTKTAPAKITQPKEKDLFDALADGDIKAFAEVYGEDFAEEMLEEMKIAQNEEKTQAKSNATKAAILTKEEKDALDVYAGNPEKAAKFGFEDTEAYSEINTYHRYGSAIMAMDEDVEAISKTLDSALRKCTLNENTTVYRGVELETHLGGELYADIKPGQTITEPGYMSTTRQTSVTDYYRGNGGAILKIDIEAGAHAVDMNLYGTGDDDEILLPRNTKLIVEDVEIKNGVKIITARAAKK